MKNKKGMEHPQEVIRMLFIAIILIFSIIIIINLMSDMEAVNTYRTNNLKYNVVATRILYSSDCYALEDNYTMGDNTRHQVHAGILDASKFVEGRLDKCLGNGEGEIKIDYINSDEEPFTDSKGCKTEVVIESLIPFTYGLKTGWKDTRKMLVSIDKNGERKGGIAEIKVCA